MTSPIQSVPAKSDSFIPALRNLNWQRLNNVLCDVTLVVCEKEFRAHRNILAAFSSYFCAMFTGEMVEKNKTEVLIHGVTPLIFSNLLDFIYTGL